MDQTRSGASQFEVDDSQNPTEAAPYDPAATSSSIGHLDSGTGRAAEGVSSSTAGAWGPVLEETAAGSSTGGSGSGKEGPAGSSGTHPMVAQLQSMIESVADQARPVLREVAAKAAELAATAAEKAGPAAHKAAETAQSVGERLAAKGKEVAADLRSSGTSPSAAESSDQRPDEDVSSTPPPGQSASGL